MTWELLIQAIGHLVWPAVMLTAIVMFRKQVVDLIARLRGFEAAGAKFTLDPAQVKQVSDDVAKGRITPEQGARHLEQTVLDEKEHRILRALVDEDHGRILEGYRSPFYRPALESALSKGYIRRQGEQYFLTDEGKKIVRDYLLRVLQ
jgi:hypothetical protein